MKSDTRGVIPASEPGSIFIKLGFQVKPGMTSKDKMKDAYYMSIALKEAQKAEKKGEVPVGAIIVKEGKIIAKGFNKPISGFDPTAHAEIIALRKAAKKLCNYRLNDCVIYVTIEPCAMCADALRQARIKKIVYGADNTDKIKIQKCKIETKSGVLKEDCAEIIQKFFQNKRKKNSYELRMTNYESTELNGNHE